jgi:cytochrome c
VRNLKAAIILSALALGSAVFVHPFGNPRVAANKGRDPLPQGPQLPAGAKKVLLTKCADCHSNETRWPIYARIPPGSWLIERDVMEGRRHMNLSTWTELTPERREVLQSKILHEAKSGDMPPLQYRMLHWDAKLSTADLQSLSALGKDEGSAEARAGGLGDAERGKAVFNKRCTGCHAIDANREGPKLRGVFGRKAGSLPGFSYSAALKALGITWNEDSLDKWLSDTDAMAPGSDMEFRVVKATERLDLIAYLKQTK